MVVLPAAAMYRLSGLMARRLTCCNHTDSLQLSRFDMRGRMDRTNRLWMLDRAAAYPAPRFPETDRVVVAAGT